MPDRIWSRELSIDELNALCTDTIHAALGIQFTEIGADSLSATMPVDKRTRQPFGILHGGASVVLAESLGSMASYLVHKGTGRQAVGIEVNANHLKAVRSGFVTGTARPVQLGNTLHVWEVRIEDSQAALVCLARLTALIRAERIQSPPTLPT